MGLVNINKTNFMTILVVNDSMLACAGEPHICGHYTLKLFTKFS